MAAQIPTLAFEARVGAAVPVSRFADAEIGFEGAAQADASFSFGFALQLRDHFGLYAGFGEHRFECASLACAQPSTLVSTGFDVGGRLSHTVGIVSPWVRAGLVSYQVQADFPEGARAGQQLSDRGVGWEVGGGLQIAVRERLAFNPAIRYSVVEVDFPVNGILDMRYLVIDLGIVVGF